MLDKLTQTSDYRFVPRDPWLHGSDGDDISRSDFHLHALSSAHYCFRLSNNFGQLQKRFRTRMGSNLVLFSIVIDPAHDQPTALADYAKTWKADSHYWHFLTGPPPEIEKVARAFDMNFYPDEALFVHSFHTVVIDREGKLAANLEGNSFSAKQLGDLVETVMAKVN